MDRPLFFLVLASSLVAYDLISQLQVHLCQEALPTPKNNGTMVFSMQISLSFTAWEFGLLVVPIIFFAVVLFTETIKRLVEEDKRRAQRRH